MTAVAITFDQENNEFVIAADGRCATYTGGSVQIASETAQKIFPYKSNGINIAYSLTGISAIGSFELIPEFEKMTKALPKHSLRSIVDGNGYAEKLFSNMGRVLAKAKEDGRIPVVPPCSLIPSSEGSKRFQILMVGYFHGERFFQSGGISLRRPAGPFSPPPLSSANDARPIFTHWFSCDRQNDLSAQYPN